MTVFLVSVATVLVVSSFCSLSEASIYAVRRPYIRRLADSGSAAGVALEAFKTNMERPIAAILIVNTAANTAGAAVAGAQASRLFGPESLLLFSALFTLAVLFISEIVPKVLGVVYNRPIATAVAVPWSAVIVALSPITWLVGRLSDWIKPNTPAMAAPEEEVWQLAQISAEEGSILDFEARLVRNALHLNEVTARDILTPRTVVFRLPSDLTVREAAARVDDWHFSRIPVHDPEDPERWTGLVRAPDILQALAHDQFHTTLAELARPLHFVPEGTQGHVMLEEFLRKRTHLFAVVDEFGGIAGVASLEDIVESLIGDEIVDEVDPAVDLQEVARRKGRFLRRGRRGQPPGPTPDPKGGDAPEQG